jgi:hypothetical protein
MGLDYLLEINEWLDIQDYLEKDVQAQVEAKHKK